MTFKSIKDNIDRKVLAEANTESYIAYIISYGGILYNTQQPEWIKGELTSKTFSPLESSQNDLE